MKQDTQTMSNSSAQPTKATTSNTNTNNNTKTHPEPDDEVERRGERGGEGGGGSPGKEREGRMKEEKKAEVTVEQTEGLSLQRTVSLLGAVSFTVGSMIGSGIFISPTSVLRNTKSVGLNLTVWALGGVLSLMGSFCVAELACRVPKHGGYYTYLNEGLGSGVAFLQAWTSVLIMGPSSLAVKALTFSSYFMTMVNMCGVPQLPVSVTAVTLIVTLCVLNMTSNILSVRTNVVFLFTKVLALIIIIIGGLVVLSQGNNQDSELSSGFEGTTDSPASVARSFYFVMWAYGGWANANTIVEEVINPTRNVPLAAILGVLMVTVIYILTNVSYLAVMSPEQMLAADTVAVTWGNAVLGKGLASIVIPLCVMTSTAGSANSGMFVNPREAFAAARDGNFPEAFSYLHVESRIPLMSISLIITLGIVYSSSTNIMRLINVTGATHWFFSFLVSISLFVLRYRQPKDLDVPFKQPLPVLVFFSLFSLFLVIVPLTDGLDFNAYFTISFLVVGLVVFGAFKLLKNRTRCCDGPVLFLQLLLRVGPPAPFRSLN